MTPWWSYKMGSIVIMHTLVVEIWEWKTGEARVRVVVKGF